MLAAKAFRPFSLSGRSTGQRKSRCPSWPGSRRRPTRPPRSSRSMARRRGARIRRRARKGDPYRLCLPGTARYDVDRGRGRDDRCDGLPAQHRIENHREKRRLHYRAEGQSGHLREDVEVFSEPRPLAPKTSSRVPASLAPKTARRRTPCISRSSSPTTWRSAWCTRRSGSTCSCSRPSPPCRSAKWFREGLNPRPDAADLTMRAAGAGPPPE